MAFPHYTTVYHNSPYPSIDPTRLELSTTGKVVFITGGGSGLGPHLVHAFAKSGAVKTAIIGRTEANLLSTKQIIELRYPGVTVLALTMDVSDQKAVNAAFTLTRNKFGPFSKGLDVNVKGGLLLAQAFLANTAENPILINIGTAGAHIGALHPGIGAYNNSKLAAVKMLDYVAAGNLHMRTVTVHPGVIDTAMNKKCNDAGLILPLDDIELAASFVVWAASPEAAFLKGKFVWVNWDVNELVARGEELASSRQLTIGLLGWP